MTVAVCLKVQDGIILASDSASTLLSGGGVQNVYNNANKVVNLRKGWPIGSMSWGAGGIGNSSMSTLAKDYRIQLTSDATKDPSQGGSYTVKEIAGELREFFKEKYEEAYPEPLGDEGEETWPTLGMFVAGYSMGAPLAECYEIVVNEQGEWEEPECIFPSEDFGILWRGQPEWIGRLIMGFSGSVIESLIDDFGLDEANIGDAIDALRNRTEISLSHPAMPIQDAVDLAEFLVDLTKGVIRFIPGAPTVGGPTEVASVTKHEGFKWVKRKHYYSREFNPEES